MIIKFALLQICFKAQSYIVQKSELRCFSSWASIVLKRIPKLQKLEVRRNPKQRKTQPKGARVYSVKKVLTVKM